MLSMMEGSRRRVPPEVDKRMPWSAKVLAEAEKSYDLGVDNLTLNNRISAHFTEEELLTKKDDLFTAEMQHTILLRDNEAALLFLP